jgi:hypothetical protein
MTPETLSSLAGIALSLLASYLPGFDTWFDKLSPNRKRLTMLGLLATTTLCCYIVACADLAGVLQVPASCDAPGALVLLRAFIAAAIANQSAYALTPRKVEGPSEPQFPF